MPRHAFLVKLAAALAVVYVVWGSTYLGIAEAERGLPPLLMLAVRFLIAGAILFGWAWRRG
jgi:drug/metabolite transporter (DMT)-like permease